MNLKSIEYFLVVAEELKVTRAAERLHISQQALSSHIRRLEDEYGVALFERKPVFRLTVAGDQLVFYGRQFLNTEGNMRAAFSDISENARATLRVGISRLRAEVFFPLIWRFYHPHHENISIELIDGNSASMIEQLALGELDLYIGVDIPRNVNQKAIALSTERMQCGFTETLLKTCYPLSWMELLEDFSKNGVDLRKISRLPFIALRQSNRLRTTVDSALPGDLKLRYIFECNQQELIYQLARAGDGAGLISPVMLYQHHRDEDAAGHDFRVFPLSETIPANICSLVYRSDHMLPAYARDFIQDSCMVFRSYTRTVEKRFQLKKQV
ncbi:DNA-binding transcriptional LysR family regulator [Moryella indoligenes]|uniref:DNA-binding transcriptional LysR family regulator n=1 Tax=Moryella indoligenes TaxID=371674 RepID=A0AAE4AL80_9FIRM|nr:LysR family transcriptional regulator [Moryella indoligenes]MDQ0152202.1 DNA-binding transcriptional LysR family regulator [Moryella indoligenes]